MERRLAAILVADIVGYSRLMGRDEERTLRAVMHLRSEMIEPLVATHRGRLVKQTGDGFLIEFASAMNAIQCALQWQARMAPDDDNDDSEEAMQFRIGLHLGDILIEQGDIYGEGVNIAARLEALAPPGGIALSGAVKHQVHTRLSGDFREAVDLAWQGVAERIDDVGGVVDGCASTGVQNNVREYLDRPAIFGFDDRSGGMALWFALEMEQLDRGI